MLGLQKENLGTYQTEVGATAADITAIAQELDQLEWVKNYASISLGDKETVFALKQQMYNGDPNAVVADFPVFPVAVPPFPPVSGILNRTLARNKRYNAAPGYTTQIGEALGIEGPDTDIDPNLVQPTIEVSAAQMGYLYTVVVSNRGDAKMWNVLIEPVDGPSGYTVAATGEGRSIDIVYPAGNDGGAPGQFVTEAVQIPHGLPHSVS
jgi:hypothetical protein